MMPKKNPYLRQYKESISSQQKLIRQRLGQPADENDAPEPPPVLSARVRGSYLSTGGAQRYQTSLRNLPNVDDDGDGEDFPSIDDETVQDSRLERARPSELQDTNRTTLSLHERNNRYSYFDKDAEESLQFFKKNLLPTATQTQTSQIISKQKQRTTSSTQVASEPPAVSSLRPKLTSTTLDSIRSPFGSQYQKSTGSLFDRQPSLSSVKGESVYVSRSRAPLEVSETSRTTARQPSVVPSNNINSSNNNNNISNSNYKYPTSKPNQVPPAKQKVLTTTDFGQEPSSVTQARRTSGGGGSSAEPRTQQRPITRPGSGELRAADELELAKMRKAAESPSRLPESPIPAETFARKPIYNSLLRAHDSIRLKVNRPKVRPRSDENATESSRVEDTEVDDTIQLAEIPTGRDSDQNLTNERAVDVKRRSSRKKSKSKKKDAADGDQTTIFDQRPGSRDENDDPQKVPVRNFSEVRVVKVVRSEDERSLGVSVKVESGNIVVARVFAGGLADKQGALQVGDIILAVNNREVYTPEQMQEQLRQSIMEDTVLLKIVPSFREELPTLCIYLRALFDYDPNEDSLLPCKMKGVAFNRGDILEVINQEDSYWQARRVDSENLETGLIPSQELEERRQAYVIPDYDLATRTSICGTKVSRKSKKKEIYNVGQNCDFDKADVQLYEEVCRTPAFERRTLVLIGANGVGKQALKARLINMDPDRFGTPLPHTSRLPRDGEEDGVHYHFVTRERMEEDIIAGKYLEYGEYDGALYGTKLDSVREIIGSGRVCVLDCSPTCLKVLKTSDYLPFVAFIAAPTLDQLRYLNDWNRGNKTYATFDRALSRQSRRAKTLQDFAFDFFEDEDLQVTVEESARLFRIYENYFDIVLVNNDFTRTFEQLRDAIDALSQAPQWIPISWIYGT